MKRQTNASYRVNSCIGMFSSVGKYRKHISCNTGVCAVPDGVYKSIQSSGTVARNRAHGIMCQTVQPQYGNRNVHSQSDYINNISVRESSRLRSADCQAQTRNIADECANNCRAPVNTPNQVIRTYYSDVLSKRSGDCVTNYSQQPRRNNSSCNS